MGAYFIKLLNRLSAKIVEKCRKSLNAMENIYEIDLELVDHPSYSPDLAPLNYYLFQNLKHLKGKKFSTNNEVILCSVKPKKKHDKIVNGYFKKNMLENKI